MSDVGSSLEFLLLGKNKSCHALHVALQYCGSRIAVSASGLVAPLEAYFGKLANCLAVPCHSKRWPSRFVHVSQHS